MSRDVMFNTAADLFIAIVAAAVIGGALWGLIWDLRHRGRHRTPRPGDYPPLHGDRCLCTWCVDQYERRDFKRWWVKS